jgi:hypothetical protein
MKVKGPLQASMNMVHRRIFFQEFLGCFSAVVHGFGGKGIWSGKFDRGRESTYDGKVGLESAAPCRDLN